MEQALLAEPVNGYESEFEICPPCCGPDCGAWALAGGELLQFDAAGALTREVSLKGLNSRLGPGAQLTLNPYDVSLWVSDGKPLLHLSAQGAVLERLSLSSPARQAALSLDETLWALGNKQLTQAKSPAGVLGSYGLQGAVSAEPRRLAVDGLRGSLWVGGEKALTRVDLSPAPRVALTVALAEPLAALALNPYTGELWVAGLELRPTLELLAPAPEALTNDPQPRFALSCGAACNGSPCRLEANYWTGLALSATLNGQMIGTQFVFDPATHQAAYTPPVRLPEGANAFRAQVKDALGHRSNSVTNSFTVDTIAPQFLSLTPAEGSTFHAAGVEIAGTVDDREATVVLEGVGPAVNPTRSTDTLSFRFPVTLAPGANPFTVSAIDRAGNVASAHGRERVCAESHACREEPGARACFHSKPRGKTVAIGAGLTYKRWPVRTIIGGVPCFSPPGPS
ncbi:MAG: hypothetical protein HYU77_11350 [Betaproteobacteria bacterium]|nr:hypothetical protein [Betaproteobacteria bacterium]